MCGLAGFLGFPVPAPEVPGLLTRMAGTLVHRGPDDQGVWNDPSAGVGLAHRRLVATRCKTPGRATWAAHSSRPASSGTS
jgi:asparagine synthase (glutamine-hydrolysing)